ncbi:MAG: FAD-binding oxidoreductase [Polyangiaceae bacterium]
MAMSRRFWGWGDQSVELSAGESAMLEGALTGLLGIESASPRPEPRIEELRLRSPRVQLPASLRALCDESNLARASHSYGKSYRDLVRALERRYDQPPDLVAYPRAEADVERLLDACSDARIAVIPYGGGSSVCGGVEPNVSDDYAGTLSLDMSALDQVLEVDETSRAARVQAGVLGPALEAQLKAHDLTLRHFPQSFEFSSLGGWIATRAGGHFATLYTHIDDLVESLRIVTPAGVVETRRLPGSGAGPDPNRLFIGSEGTLGVISEAWMRVFPRPTFRAKATVRYANLVAGARALRALTQSGLYPANARLLDPVEAMLNGAGDGSQALLLVGFESHDHELGAWIARAVELCRDFEGQVAPEDVTHDVKTGAADGAAGAWRKSFLRAPYLRDGLVLRGAFVETYETAVTWDRFESLHAAVMTAARDVVGASAVVTCRVTHAYPDGAAPYFTVIAPARPGAELEQWDEVKAAITRAMLDAGGTTTHHHAVGRDFRVYYEREVPELVRHSLLHAKRSLDPSSVMNPGSLLSA